MIIAIYGLWQMELKKEGVLGQYAEPLNSKHDTESIEDAKAIYKWLSYQLIDVSEQAINRQKSVFNDIVNKLEQEYLLNMFMLAIFMLENMLGEDGSTPQKIVFMPKVNRLVKHMRAGIMKHQDEEAFRIVKDSKIAAGNIIRVFNGEPELTKQMRNWSAKQWREAV